MRHLYRLAYLIRVSRNAGAPGGANELKVTPVVVDGIMLVTSANDAFALEARTGHSIWHYSCPVTEGLIDDASQHHNRGVAVWRSKVLLHCRKNAVKFNRYKPPSILSECAGAEGRERIENAFKSVYS